jgi:hypothetical protein
MQHHGLPTRFLDWSTTFAVALYFAIASRNVPSISQGESACVWMMNPFELNKQAAGEAAVYNPTIDLKGDYYQNFITRSKSLGAPVMAINPSRATPRQASQRSVFTLHNDIWSPLEATYPEQLIRVDIPITCIPEAKEFLQLAGINEYTLFPDFDGLARHLHQEHAKHF